MVDQEGERGGGRRERERERERETKVSMLSKLFDTNLGNNYCVQNFMIGY